MTAARTQQEARPGPVRVRLDPETRRRQIVDEATRLIAVSGFNAVSLADIAEACGIRKPSVLHYFPSMGHLLAAVLSQRDVQADGDVGGPDSPRDVDSVRAYLRNVVVGNIQMREIIRLYAVLAAESTDPGHPAHAYFAERHRLALHAVRGMLQWKKDPDTAARELLAFWQGLELLWVLDPSTDFLTVWDAFCDRFFVAD